MTTTFKNNGVTYTVTPLSESDNQQAINIAVDVLWQVAQQRKWNIDADNRNRLSSYPYAVQNAAIEYAELFLSTALDGTPKHAFPANLLDAVDGVIFGQWLTDIQNSNGLKSKWLAAFAEANKAESDPQASSADEMPEKI